MNAPPPDLVARSYDTLLVVSDAQLFPLPATYGIANIDPSLKKMAYGLDERSDAQKLMFVYDLLENYAKNVYNATIYGIVGKGFLFGDQLPSLDENTMGLALAYIAQRLPFLQAEIDAIVISSRP